MKKYVLDLETTAHETQKTRLELLDDSSVFCCAALYANISENPTIIESYGRINAKNTILSLPEGTYYIHNGSRYDCTYILPILENAGYIEISDDNKKLNLLEYKYLIANNKVITMSFRNYNGTIKIMDSCLLFSCSLENFIKNTCPEKPKLVGQYNYKKYREHELDFNEIDKKYCISDVEGFSIGMHRIQKEFNEAFNLDILEYYTAGSFAINYARKYINLPELPHEIVKLNKTNKFFNDNAKKGEKLKKIYNSFDTFLPKINFPREYVMGGKTYLNEKYKGKILENVTKIDANSFYPYIMEYCKLPIGKPIKKRMSFEQLKEYLIEHTEKYVFASLTSGLCYYDDMYSPITLKLNRGINAYVTDAIYSCGVFLDDNILRDDKFICKGSLNIYIFEGRVGLFPYMTELYKLKNKYKINKQFALELAVKIILNSTYGKFLQRFIVDIYKYLDGKIYKTNDTKELQKWYNYAPIGAAITANARYILTNGMNVLGENFIYCDTDSLSFIGDIPEYFSIGNELGQWKIEENSVNAVFFDRKTYAVETNKGTFVTFAGISEEAIKKVYPRKEEGEELQKLIENGYPLYDITLQKLLEDLTEKGVRFMVLQGNRTKTGTILIERFRTKKFQAVDGNIYNDV
jgi:hypothetical protein